MAADGSRNYQLWSSDVREACQLRSEIRLVWASCAHFDVGVRRAGSFGAQTCRGEGCWPEPNKAKGTPFSELYSNVKTPFMFMFIFI